MSQEHEIDLISLPRHRRPPSRFSEPGAAHQAGNAHDYYRAAFCVAIDTAINQVQERMDKKSDSLCTYRALEEMLLTNWQNRLGSLRQVSGADSL